MNTILKLPLVNVKWQMKRDTEGNSQGEPSKARDIPSRDGRVYVRVEPEESCVLRVELTRTTLQGGKVMEKEGHMCGAVGVLCVRREGGRCVVRLWCAACEEGGGQLVVQLVGICCV